MITRINARSVFSGLFLVVFALCLCSGAQAYDAPKNLQEGWDGSLQLGALATFGAVDTSAYLARTDVTYRGEQWENEFNVRLYRSTTQITAPRRDANGDQLVGGDGVAITDLIRTTSNDRRFFSAQPRWFFSSRHYLFAIVDLDINKPIDVELSSRQIVGVGYKLWNKRNDSISAAVGVGRKRLEQVSGNTEEGAIGYLGFRFNRSIGKGVALVLDLDSDFGGENRSSELEVAIGWKLRNPFSIKLKYDARLNSNIVNLISTFNSDIEAALSVNLEVEIF